MRKTKQAKMQSIKINKIATIWLMIVIVVGTGLATPKERLIKERCILERITEGKMHIWGGYPKIGEIFEVVYRLRIKETEDPWVINYLKQDFCAIVRCIPPKAAEIIGKNKFFFSGSTYYGKWQEFRIRVRILKPVPRVCIDGSIELVSQGKPNGAGPTRGMINLYLIDPQTGQYGTWEEYEKGLSVEYRYDPLVGTFTCSPSQNPAPVEENRAILKMIKQLAPTLNDSLAFVLHSEQYRVGIPKGLPKWDSLNQRWREEEIFEYYLKDGWLKALQENRLEDWREQEKQKILSEYKEKKSQIFLVLGIVLVMFVAFVLIRHFMGSGATKTITTTKTRE